MVMGAGEAEAAAAIGPLVGPGRMLGHALAGQDVRIGPVGVVALAMGLVGRDRGENRRHAFHVVRKTHVISTTRRGP